MKLVNPNNYSNILEASGVGFLVCVVMYLVLYLSWQTFALYSAATLVAMLFLHSYRLTKIIAFTREIAFTYIGLILGFYFDFGIINIQSLYDICSQGNMVKAAPLTFGGMFLLCNLNLLLSKKSATDVTALLFANIGMVLGMVIFETFHDQINILKPQYLLFLHVSTMIACCHLFHFLVRNIKLLPFKS